MARNRNYPEEVIDKIRQEVKMRTYDDKYLDQNEEKEILRIGIELKMDVDDTLALILSICNEIGTVCERHIEITCKDMLKVYAENDGKIDKKEFDDVTQLYLNKTQGRISQQEAQRRLKKIIVNNRWIAKEGGFFGNKWFSAIPN